MCISYNSNIHPIRLRRANRWVTFETPACAQSTSTFLSLPGEVRNEIYTHYLSFTTAEYISTRNPSLDFFEKQPRPVPALMLTCKKAHTELKGLAGGRAAVRVSWRDFTAITELAYYGRMVWSWVRELRIVVAMQRRRFNCWVSFVDMVLRRCTGLQELVVEWHPDREESEELVHVGTRWTDKCVGDELRLLRELAVREFLVAVSNTSSLRRVGFLGNVPNSWLEYLRMDASATVTKSKLVLPQAQCEGSAPITACQSGQAK